jgi:aldehyde dehydrogenase (NAD+)
MATAVYDPNAIEYPASCFIDGKFAPADGPEYEVLRPSDGAVARRERSASAEMVARAVEAAERANQTSGWAQMEPRGRARIMRKWAELAEGNADELARLESVVSARVVSEVRAHDVRVVAEYIRYYGELADKYEGQVFATAADVWSLTVREPYGVVAAISPWNFPLILSTLKLAPALAAGNAVVLKPSELTPYAVLRLAQLGHEAGVPPGQIGVVNGAGPETGAALVRHPSVSFVSFTGSTATGTKVMVDAATSGLKPVALELGGKSPQLVFGDIADLDRVAEIVAGSVCRNAGQVCYAGTRLVVQENIADALVEKVAKLVQKVRPGPTWDSSTTLAPIISEKQGRRIGDILERGKSQGAEILTGGARFDSTGGFYFRPTIVLNAKQENPVIREEIFGPVLAVQRFRDEEEGLALADHPIYGLAAAVHTNDINRALRAARSIQAGTVWVNHFGLPHLAAPFGGYKQSGFGKDFGMAGLEKYLRTKSIRILTR